MFVQPVWIYKIGWLLILSQEHSQVATTIHGLLNNYTNFLAGQEYKHVRFTTNRLIIFNVWSKNNVHVPPDLDLASNHHPAFVQGR